MSAAPSGQGLRPSAYFVGLTPLGLCPRPQAFSRTIAWSSSLSPSGGFAPTAFGRGSPAWSLRDGVLKHPPPLRGGTPHYCPSGKAKGTLAEWLNARLASG